MWSSSYGSADRVLDWRRTTRVPLGSISPNVGPSSPPSEPYTQPTYPNFGSSTPSVGGYTPIQPYYKPEFDRAPTLSPGEPSPPSLSSLAPRALSLVSAEEGLVTCSSCGANLPDQTQLQDPVKLLPCGHSLCSTCLSLLVNAASNVPPRSVDCFGCGQAVDTFVGLRVKGGPGAGEGTSAGQSDTWSSSRNGKRNEEDDKYQARSSQVHSSGSQSYGIPNLRLGHRSNEPDSPATPKQGHNIRSPKTTRSSGEIPSPIPFHVIRIDNVPWSLTTEQVREWLPPDSLPPEDQAAHPIHILIDRATYHTLNQAYVELVSLDKAQEIVRANLKGGKIANRPIGVALSSQQELLENVFPGWEPGFIAVNAADPSHEGTLITSSELDHLAEQFLLTTVWARRAPERMFFQVATIVAKLPWHQPETYAPKLVAKLFTTVQEAVRILKHSSCGEFDGLEDVLTKLMKVALDCPGFRHSQKAALWEILDLNIDSPGPSEGGRVAADGTDASPSSHRSAPAECQRRSTYDLAHSTHIERGKTY